MVNLTRVEQIGSIDAGSQSPRSFFSDLSPARRSDPEAAPLLTTIVTRDDSASNGCSSTSSVAIVTPGSSNNANTTRLTPTLEHVYEAAWVDELRIVVASRGLPLHLYDIEGCHVASFGAQDAWSGSFEQAYSTTCEEGGRVLYAGSANALYSWEVERPGNEILCCMYPRWDDEYRDISLGNETRPCARRRRKHDIVSSVAAGGGKQLVALGAYSGRVALFDMRTGMQEMFIDGLSSAVTQVAFHDGTQALVVACRAKGAGLSGDSDVPDLYVFDMRGSLGRGACLYEVCRQLADDGRATRRGECVLLWAVFGWDACDCGRRFFVYSFTHCTIQSRLTRGVSFVRQVEEKGDVHIVLAAGRRPAGALEVPAGWASDWASEAM